MIGPLVIAGLVMREENVENLTRIGVRDSKSLSGKVRATIASKIVELAEEHALVEIQPQEVDSIVMRGRPMMRLNWLEAKYFSRILERLGPEVAYVDAPDRSPERFACQILLNLNIPLRIIAEHRADVKYPIVSAASILAKVRRDTVISELKRLYGDFGSGYPSDPKTVNFLREWMLKNRGDLPILRRSWSTFRRVEAELF
ncbi:MAG: ribonuclease HII [Candidatus Bathyarchaeia archaeon]